MMGFVNCSKKVILDFAHSNMTCFIDGFLEFTNLIEGKQKCSDKYSAALAFQTLHQVSALFMAKIPES
jgi:hypothetical protein